MNPRADTLFDLFEQPAVALMRAAHEGIMMVDVQQRIVALNPAAEQMFRCAPGQALGRRLDDFIPPEHREAHRAKVAEFGASVALPERLVRHRRTTAVRCDGTVFPVEIALSKVDMAVGEGRQASFVALVLDLSEEDALRDEIERFKRRLRSVFELAPVAIWITENDHVVFANQAAERLFGSSLDLVGQPLYTLLQPSSHATVRTQVARVLAGDPDVSLVHGHITRHDGTQREVEIALAALPDHGRTTVQMVVADVTNQRRAAAELEQSRESLRRLSTSVVEAREEERRRIARELHDELGQRLTALKMELSALPGTVDQAARQERVDNMLTMLDDTLASVRRISSDLRPMMLDDLGLNAAIEWLARDAARRMGIEVTVCLDENDEPLDDRVATAVFRMVQEALTNVARHARATEVHVAVRQHDGELDLTVEDNGIGYAQSAMQREGSFGLMGMRERVTMLGGRFEIGNAPGSGARLTVQLPLTRPPRPDAPLPAGGST